jgi:flagellar biogenesis protein FliO
MVIKASIAIIITMAGGSSLANTPRSPQSPIPVADRAQEAGAGAPNRQNPSSTGSAAQLEDPGALSLPNSQANTQLRASETVKPAMSPSRLQSKNIQKKLTTNLAPVTSSLTTAASDQASNSLESQQDTISSKNAPKSSSTDAKQPKALALGTITTEVEGDLTIVTARLNAAPRWQDLTIEEHGTFLQIKLRETLIPNSGDFLDGNGPFLKKIASFQVGETDGALRLFVNQDAAKAKLATSAELLGDRVVITIDHKKMEQLIAPNRASATSSPQTADEVLAKTTIKTDEPAPSAIISGASSEKKEATDNQNLYSQLTKIAGFFAVLFVGFIGLQLFKSKRFKKSPFSAAHTDTEPAALKVLSSIAVGQRQKLTLVQVGSQQVLIGVSPESINLITAIENKPKTPNFATQLQMANPNAEVRLKDPNEIRSHRVQRKSLTTGTNDSPSLERSKVQPSSSINIAIDDNGPRSIPTKATKKEDDITRILRDRLRNLPPG